MIDACVFCVDYQHCLKCESDSLYPDGDTCHSCSEVFSHCLTCSLEDKCTKCESALYVLDHG